MRLFLQGFTAGVAVGLCISLIIAAFEYYDLYITRLSVLIIALFFWCCVAVFALLLLLILVRRFRPAAIRFLSAGLGMLAFMAVTAQPTVEFAHGMVLEHEMEFGGPVVAALELFQVEHQSPAGALSDLIPGFLQKIPKPTRDVCDYRYQVSAINTDPKPHGNSEDPADLPGGQRTWEFSIECPADWLFDVEVLVYRPDGEYETVESAWKQRPIGDWMYYYFRD